MTTTAAPLSAFAEALVHELRTPLTAIAAEVDLALARERPAEAYRGALARIAECLAELVDLTGDFALCGAGSGLATADTSRLAAIVESLRARYGARRGTPVTFVVGALDGSVAGGESLIAGALSLVIEHAIRHRRSGSRVALRAMPPAVAPAATIDFVVEAVPGGFSPSAWDGLRARPSASDATGPELRIPTAAAIIRGCGGALALESGDGAECVVIRLRAARMARSDEADRSL